MMKTLHRITIFVLLPVIAVVVGAAGIYHFHGQSAARAAAERRLQSSGQLAAELIRREVTPLVETLRSLSAQQALANYLDFSRAAWLEERDWASRELERSMERLACANPRIEAIELYDAGGASFARYTRDPGEGAIEQVQDSPWYQAAFSEGRSITFDEAGRIRLAICPEPEGGTGTPIVASLTYDFRGSLSEAAEFATRALEGVQVVFDGGTVGELLRFGPEQITGRAFEAHTPIPELGLSLTVRQSESAALSGFQQAQRLLWTALAVMTLGLLAVAAAGTQWVIRDLREAQRRTEQADAAKSEFLATMSHEIRTPLNGLIGLLELLTEARLKQADREHLTLAREAAETLLRLLNDILDFSKIEAGKLELESVPFELRGLLETTLQTLAARATEKGLRLKLQIAAEVPARLIGDPGRLRQVLVNLVGNALKFTSQGEVAVSVRRAPLDASRGEAANAGVAPAVDPPRNAATTGPPEEIGLLLSVRDTGIGIPEDKRQRIFEAFAQADNSISRRYGGTGLGLAIVAKLVASMRGRLWLESEVGVGTVFHVLVPLGVSAAQPAGTVSLPLSHAVVPPGESPPPKRPVRILLAEDSVINQMVASRLLERRGHRVSVANNGQAALELLLHETFDVVLMDVEMPEMDGITATQIIRQREAQTGEHIPIIAMTAHAIKGDRERFLAAGMDDYLAKPFNSHQLYERVERPAGNGHHPTPNAVLEPLAASDGLSAVR